MGSMLLPSVSGAGVRGAGEGNRTLVVSLEGFCSTIELHPREPFDPSTVRAPSGQAARHNKYLVEEVGFEPT